MYFRIWVIIYWLVYKEYFFLFIFFLRIVIDFIFKIIEKFFIKGGSIFYIFKNMVIEELRNVSKRKRKEI